MTNHFMQITTLVMAYGSFLFAGMAQAAEQPRGNVKVFILTGQSNMEGKGRALHLDTYKDDPLANLKLEIGSYKKIGLKVASYRLPRFAVLEGGYSHDLPLCIESFLDGFFQ